MRGILLLLLLTVVVSGCNQERVYHAYVDFEDRYWLTDKVPQFTFTIEDTTQRYNVYCNIRNSTWYPYSRIFIKSSLQDTLGNELKESLLNDFLFEEKTGKPLGKSGLGDLYDHQLPVLKNHKFTKAGAYRIRFEQFMRTDTLEGILSVGLGVDRVMKP